MALRYYANAPATTLTTSVSSSGTNMVVASVSGLPVQYPFTIIVDRGLSTEEVCTVTGAAGATLTVTRGADSTTAFAHGVGSAVVHGISAQDPREANAHVNANSGVHGITGNVVGTSDSQSLTNKTLGNTNTLNGFTANRMTTSDGSGKLVAGTSPIPTGNVVGESDAQTLTNKTLGSTNVINGFTASRFMQSDGSGRLAASSKTLPTGAVVGDSDTQTLTSKTFTGSTFTSTSNTFGTHIAFVGELRMTAASTADTGWLICDGAAVSRATYSALFSKIGTTYGVGDGSTTFNLPDFRDRFPTGASGTKALAATGGSATKTLSAANLPPHKHTVAMRQSSTSGGPQPNAATAQGTADFMDPTPETGNGPGTTSPFDVMNPWLAINFVIKF